MRYSQPRKLKTRRGRLKSEQNAWCWVHRVPMERHGKNFVCRGHWSTRACSSRGAEFVKRSRAITGHVGKHEATKWSHPYCVNCKIRMHRNKRSDKGTVRYRCRLCHAQAGSRLAPRHFEDYKRQADARKLIRAGYQTAQIERRLKMHYKTIKNLRAEIPDEEIAKCACGKIKFHSHGCGVRTDVRSVLAQQRSEFDTLRVRISRSLPGLPAEYREDAIQDVIAVVLEAGNQIIRSLRGYRTAGYVASLDDNPVLADTMIG